MFLAASIQGSVGFGANVLAVPILYVINPIFVPGPVLLAGFGINILMLYRDYEAASIRPVANALVGRAVGTGFGLVALGLINERGLALLVAVVVTAVIVISAIGFSAPRTPRNMVIGGVLSGFGASTSGIGGPPVALLFRDGGGPEVRGSLGAFFVIGNVISLGGLALAGRFGSAEITTGAFLIPAAIAGFLATRWIVPLLDRGHTRTAILTVSSVAVAALVVDLLLTR